MARRLLLAASFICTTAVAAGAKAQPEPPAAEPPAAEPPAAEPKPPETTPEGEQGDEPGEPGGADTDVDRDAPTQRPDAPQLPDRDPDSPEDGPEHPDSPDEVKGEAAQTQGVEPDHVDAPISADEERPLPDYDGRGDDPVTAGDVLIWIPRGIFYPLYLVTEYVIRWPIGKITVAVEEYDIPAEIAEFFTFGPGNNYGIVPSFLIDFGIRPSIGLYFFGDDVGDVPGLGIRSHLAFGGIDWYRATGSVRYDIEQETVDTHLKFIQLKGTYSHRPDWQYWGQGPRSLDDNESSFTMQQIEGALSYVGGFWRSSYILADAGVRDTIFKENSCCAPVSLVTAVDRGLFPKPEVFDDGYTLAFAGVEASLDTRPERFNFEGDVSDHVSPPGHGVKIGGRVDFGGGLRETLLTTGESRRPLFLRYGGTLGGFVDLHNQRVIGLQLVADFVDPLGDGIVPFTELVDLGGSRPLRGFQARRLVDRSAAAAILEYSWPIWVWLDGTAHYAVGNVFGEHLKGFEPGLWRQSFGFGFRANAARDHTFELLIAGGTETFDEGADPESFRFVFGSTAGF